MEDGVRVAYLAFTRENTEISRAESKTIQVQNGSLGFKYIVFRDGAAVTEDEYLPQ